MKKQKSLRFMKPTMAVFLLAAALIIFYLGSSAEAQYNYDHVNVTTIVNITNAFPEILNMTLTGEVDNVTLLAGTTKTIFCNATIRDWNGFNDINVVNATLFYYLNASNQNDDNNEHYTNTTCPEIDNDGAYTANYSCSFEVYYYAFNGTWTCNMTVYDQSNFEDADDRDTFIESLFALNVTNVIDYGNLSVTDTSSNVTANVTNFGNADINVSVLGYGLTQGDGIGLVCAFGDNISVGNERFSSSLLDWADKTVLTTTNQVMNMTLPRRVSDTTEVVNSTYWQLYVPPNPFGECNGTVRFTATAP